MHYLINKIAIAVLSLHYPYSDYEICNSSDNDSVIDICLSQLPM